jgi:hypothetical protein
MRYKARPIRVTNDATVGTLRKKEEQQGVQTARIGLAECRGL